MRPISTTLFCVLLGVAGCSCPSPSGSVPAGGATRDGAVTDGGGEPVPVNGCTAADFAANDRRAEGAARVVVFPSTPAPGPYAPRCMTISAGQSVTWTGDFGSHPLAQSGGDPSQWIEPTARGSTATFAFPVAGVYGFHCTAHATTMQGAVLVR